MPVLLHLIDAEADVLLRDGTTTRLRPVRDDDAPAVLAPFERLSERSLYYRFMTVPRLDLDQARPGGGRSRLAGAARGRACRRTLRDRGLLP